MKLYHGTNVRAAAAISAHGFEGDHVFVSSDQGSALLQARCGTGTAGPWALVTIEVDADESALSCYRIDEWEGDHPPKVDYKLPLPEFARRITVTSLVACTKGAFS